ncbi:Mediator of RNA polymerase II transcription subunit 23 [Nymphon striatum]|nr:Mediator of RNA polymerase II transcription subunit 23 [Nymphon striatum]
MVHNDEQEKNHFSKILYYQEGLKNLLTGLSAEAKVSALRFYIYSASNNCNQQRIKSLFSILEHSVNSSAVSPKLVCDAVLNCEKLTIGNQDFWCEGFHLIKRIIGGVDYKGVRDLMKDILEKASLIPAEVNVSMLPQVYGLTQVIEYIFDRNACLLPSYFVVNEVQKMFPDYKSWPHWKLAKLLSDFCDSFIPVAQMVSIVGRTKLLPIVGHSAVNVSNMWKLDSKSLKFYLRGLLPYKKAKPQGELLRFVIEQPYSNDIVCSMLGLNKKTKIRCPALEEQLVELVTIAMEKSETENESQWDDGTSSHLMWQHLSSQLIFFVLFQFAKFPHMVMLLHSKLSSKNLRKGRDHLMWVLLQFISGSIQNNPLNDFLPVLKLFDLLFPEKEPLLIPNTEKVIVTRQMAGACIWMHLMKKAQSDQTVLSRSIPVALKSHFEYLQQNVMSNQPSLSARSEYGIALLCNALIFVSNNKAVTPLVSFLFHCHVATAYSLKNASSWSTLAQMLNKPDSTNQEYFVRPLQILVENIHANQKIQTPMPGNCMAGGPTQPLSVEMLDSLTVHAKMSLIHNIVTQIIKLAQTKSSLALAPALVETYSRLLVYTEIESLGVKGFIGKEIKYNTFYPVGQLLPTVFKSHAYGILHTLLEMFSYRLHHIQPHYRVQLLSHLHSLASVPQTNQTQLHLCVESTALRLITGLGSNEVQPQLSRFLSDPKTLISMESEELNRALVLTLARAMYVTGSETLSGTWCKELITTIMQNTPHSWSSYTLAYFPPVLAEIFQQTQPPKENISQLKVRVEEEYRKWKSMSNENDIIAHFSLQGTPPLFLWVLERVGARALSAHLRTLADFLVYEFSVSVGPHVKKALRSFEGNEAQVCIFIIQLLLLKPVDFRNRFTDFVKENSPEHWKQSNWHEKHIAFHKKYPEKYQYEADHTSQSNQPYLPVYFGNVCLRFLPVSIGFMNYKNPLFLTLSFIGLLKVPSQNKATEHILDHLSILYKFHDQPITYLHNTLHYYERNLKERPALKKKLVASIIGSQKEIREKGWCLSEAYEEYMEKHENDVSWTPEPDYYIGLVGKLVATINGKIPSSFSSTDWRYNEFPNASVHVLHCICVELMALPVSSSTVGNALLDVVLKGHTQIPRSSIESWINAIALILTALPDSYWLVLHTHILKMLETPMFVSPSINPSSNFDLMEAFDFTKSHQMYREVSCSYLLALTHAIWHHATIGQISKLPIFLKTELKIAVKTEEQFLYVCHLVAPFLLRFNNERPKCVMEITVELYKILENVDRNCAHMYYMDCICDLLYHIKYMFIGDSVKIEAEKVIRNLRPALQLRLRFITHLNLEEVIFQSTENATPEAT